jgi:conjugal transfer ATP-binding protein TraC
MLMQLKLIRKANFEDLFPIWGLEENTDGQGQIIFKDGRVGIGYQVACIETERLSSGEYNKIGESFTAALADLPPDVTVQLLGFYHYLPYDADLQDKSNYEYKILMNYLQRPVQQHQQYLFISYGTADIKEKSPVNNLYVRKGMAYVSNPFKGIEKVKIQLESMANAFISKLTQNNISYKRLDKAMLKSVVLQYFNLKFDEPQKFISNAFQPHRDCLQIGQKLVGIASMDGQAKEIFYDHKNEHGVFTPTILPLGNELALEHILSITWKSLDTEPAIRSLESKARWTNNLGFLSSQAHDTQSEEIREHIDEVTKGGRKLFDMNVSVIFWGLGEKIFSQNKDLVGRAFGKIRASAFIEQTDTSALFFCNSPANSYQNYRWIEKITNENAAIYANYISHYKSENRGELLCDRYGSPVYADFYSPKLNGNNFMVIGPTGSGKSYTIGYMIIQRQERGERQIIIDVGGTYKTIFFGNKKSLYYEYNPSDPLKYNPFLIHRSSNGIYDLKSRENELKPTFLMSLIATIWLGTDRKLEPAELAILGELVVGYYDVYNETLLGVPSIDGFYQYILAYREKGIADPKSIDYLDYERRQRFFDFNKLIITLKQFAKGGLYGEILNAETLDDISAFPLICFDLAKIKENPTLYPIVGMMISELAADILAKYPNDIRRIYIDEAWSMLSGLGNFIENMYRTIRKIKGVIGIITQGINEIKKSGIGEIVKANSSTIIILNHEDSDVLKGLCEYMGLTEHQEDLAKSLRKSEKWREIFVKQGEFAKVYRVEVPLYIAGLITSFPDDRNYIRDVAGENGENITLALNRWIEQKTAQLPDGNINDSL